MKNSLEFWERRFILCVSSVEQIKNSSPRREAKPGVHLSEALTTEVECKTCG